MQFELDKQMDCGLLIEKMGKLLISKPTRELDIKETLAKIQYPNDYLATNLQISDLVKFYKGNKRKDLLSELLVKLQLALADFPPMIAEVDFI